jgi:hypothetical protein
MANLFYEQLEEQSSGKDKKVYLCIHLPTQRIEAICSTREKAEEYNDLQVKLWNGNRNEFLIVERTIDEDYLLEKIFEELDK